MKALMYTAPQRVEIQQVGDPELRDGDALVAVDAVGICGSDMHAYLGHDPRRVPPMILGHEVAATVIEGQHRGERVVVNPLMTCGQCDACLDGRANLCPSRELIGMNRPGGFAERLAIPQQNLIPIPTGLAAEHAALTEPAATALHALHLAAKASARTLNECRAIVIGGGSVGLCAALLLIDQGCRQVRLAETNPLRRATATRAGIDSFDPLTDAPGEMSVDLVIDAVGAAVTRQLAVHTIAPGGVIMHIGLQSNDDGVDMRKLTLQEVTLIGTYTYTMVDMRATLAKIAAGALGDAAWVDVRALDQGADAFADLYASRSAAAKIVLTPNPSA